MRANNFDPQWRYGLYPFSHFHSNTYEILAVYSGRGLCRFGGDTNPGAVELELRAGDLAVVPPGLAHKGVDMSRDFMAVGSYPMGLNWDTCRGETRGAEERIREARALERDPVYGSEGPALEYLVKN